MTSIFTAEVSLEFIDTALKGGYLQKLSLIKVFSPTRKSENRVFHEIAWTSVVYLLLLNCTHRAHLLKEDMHEWFTRLEHHQLDLNTLY